MLTIDIMKEKQQNNPFEREKKISWLVIKLTPPHIFLLLLTQYMWSLAYEMWHVKCEKVKAKRDICSMTIYIRHLFDHSLIILSIPIQRCCLSFSTLSPFFCHSCINVSQNSHNSFMFLASPSFSFWLQGFNIKLHTLHMHKTNHLLWKFKHIIFWGTIQRSKEFF